MCVSFGFLRSMEMQITCLVIVMVIGTSDAFNNFADTKCGQSKYGTRRLGRVVGGENANKAEFPWLVSITRRGGHFCGGTLISSRFVLTAGHCLCSGIGYDILKPNNIKVTISQHDLTQKDSEAFEMAIKSMTVHPEYVCSKARNDIAIIELVKPVEWSESVSPACLPIAAGEREHKSIDNKIATVAGWGWTNEDSSKGGRAKTLQKAKVNVFNNDKCRSWFKAQGKKTQIQHTQICAGHEQGGVDACWADSGGPLMVDTEQANQMMVVGVVSTGIGCARPYLPGLYTRVSEYIPWIKGVIQH